MGRQRTTKKRLMLGGYGETERYQQQGWIVLDGSGSHFPDIIATIPPLPSEVTSQKWDEIAAIHFVEHLYREDALTLTRELRKVLAPDGVLFYEQSDLDYVMRVALGDVAAPTERYPWMKGDARWCGIWNIYPQPFMIDGNELNTHRFGYNPATLRELLIEAGFDDTRITQQRARSHVIERDFRMVAKL